MKKFNKFLILFGIFTSPSYASFDKAKEIFDAKPKNLNDFTMIGVNLLKNQIYFSAIPFFKEALILKNTQVNEKFDQHLELLIYHVGIEHFRALPLSILNKSQAPSIKFLMAEKYYEVGEFDKAMEMLNGFPEKHLIYSKALMLQASLANFKGKIPESISLYQACMKAAKRSKNMHKEEHLKRMYSFIEDSCYISIPRAHYKAKNYEISQKLYREIPKQNYRWPSILLEDAWNSFRLKDYNRTIGRLLTYKAPILSDFFFPEAEVLSAMSYVELCLWDDAIQTINYYQKTYAPNSKKLIELLQQNGSSSNFFYKLSTNPENNTFKDFKFLEQRVNHIKIKPYYFVNAQGIKDLFGEYRKIKSKNKSKFRSLLVRNLKFVKDDLEIYLNQYVKKSLFDIANELKRTSNELTVIHLEAYTRQKEMLYQAKTLSDRSRGDVKNINRSSAQYFWMFKEEFWADELGDYVLGLDSNCKQKENT